MVDQETPDGRSERQRQADGLLKVVHELVIECEKMNDRQGLIVDAMAALDRRVEALEGQLPQAGELNEPT